MYLYLSSLLHQPNRCYSYTTPYIPSRMMAQSQRRTFSPAQTRTSSTLSESRSRSRSNSNSHHDETHHLQKKKRKHLVLVGGGHAHVQVIKALNKQARPFNLDVTLIDVQSSAIYSGMVPGCVSKLYTPEETQIHLRPLASWANIQFIQNAVVNINLENKRLILADNSSDNSSDNDNNNEKKEVEYDCVSFDIGSTSKGIHTIPGVKEYTIPTRPISALMERFEQMNTNPENNDNPVVVVGAGAAGIELAMAIRARWNPKHDILILNGGTEIFSNETQICRNAIHNALNEKRIVIRNECTVQKITQSHIHIIPKTKINHYKETDVETIPYSHCLWAAGAAPHVPLIHHLRDSGLALDETGWIRVGPTLQSVSHPEIFAAGDCATMEGRLNGKPSPPKAGVYAVRSGPILINNLIQFTCGGESASKSASKSNETESQDNSNFNKETKQKQNKIPESLIEYEPQDDFLKLIMCGDGTAIGFRFGLPLYGKWVWQLKDRIDRMFMDLFDAQYLPQLKQIHDENDGDGDNGDNDDNDDEKQELDMSQYDAVAERPEPLSVSEAVTLLKRTDDDVDYEQAWNVIRDMMADEEYKTQVLAQYS